MKRAVATEVEELLELIFSTTGALVHVTDERNFHSIERHGLLSKAAMEQIGIEVWNPGGSALTMSLDQEYGLSDYVFAAFKLGGIMPKHGNSKQRRPRTLLLDPTLLRRPGVKIALGRANHARTEVYGVKRAVRKMPHEHFAHYLSGEVDWSDQQTRHHYSRIADYEILIPGRIEPSCILGWF